MPSCCINPDSQLDAAPKGGYIRSVCRVCGKWLGNRPIAIDSKKTTSKKEKAVT